MTTLPDPTVVDMIDAVVRASNDLVVWELANRKLGEPTMTEGAWTRFVKADYLVNSVQDSINGYDDDDEPTSITLEAP